jgi:hypothetical protein
MGGLAEKRKRSVQEEQKGSLATLTGLTVKRLERQAAGA